MTYSEDIESITSWFKQNYTAPQDELYHDREDETGYAWMGLSQNSPGDVLAEQFEGTASPKDIEEASSALADEAMYWISNAERDEMTDNG